MTLRGSEPDWVHPVGRPERLLVQYGGGGVHGVGTHPYAPAVAQ